jgi:peroxiredoxin Q/BCP
MTKSKLKEGELAPAFRLTTDSGRQISLSDYRGKRVVLFFYPKANTPG